MIGGPGGDDGDDDGHMEPEDDNGEIEPVGNIGEGRNKKAQHVQPRLKTPAYNASIRSGERPIDRAEVDSDAKSLDGRNLSIDGEGEMLPEETTPEEVYEAFETALKAANTDPDIHIDKHSDNFYAYRDDPAAPGGKLVLASTSVPSKGLVRLTLSNALFKAENIHLMGGLASFASGREFKVKSSDIDHVNALIQSFGKKSLIFDDTDPSKSAYNAQLAAIPDIRLLSKENKAKHRLI